jgi:hypothetical protein
MNRYLMAILALVVLAAPGFAQQITTDYDHQFDLSSLKTFGFAVQNRDAKDALVGNDIVDRRIHAALDAELQKNGFKSSGSPDFKIAYYASIAQKKTVTTSGYGRPRWGSTQVWIDEYTEGTVVVDFLNAKTGEAIWRASATRTLDPKNSEKNINKGTEKLIKQLMKNIKDQQKANAKKK